MIDPEAEEFEQPPRLVDSCKFGIWFESFSPAVREHLISNDPSQPLQPSYAPSCPSCRSSIEEADLDNV
jgi:hypothetical protein